MTLADLSPLSPPGALPSEAKTGELSYLKTKCTSASFWERMIKRGEREGEADKDSQADRKTNRRADRQTDRPTGRQADGKIDRQIGKQRRRNIFKSLIPVETST